MMEHILMLKVIHSINHSDTSNDSAFTDTISYTLYKFSCHEINHGIFTDAISPKFYKSFWHEGNWYYVINIQNQKWKIYRYYRCRKSDDNITDTITFDHTKSHWLNRWYYNSCIHDNDDDESPNSITHFSRT